MRRGATGCDQLQAARQSQCWASGHFSGSDLEIGGQLYRGDFGLRQEADGKRPTQILPNVKYLMPDRCDSDVSLLSTFVANTRPITLVVA